jgi:hypothetical protein
MIPSRTSGVVGRGRVKNLRECDCGMNLFTGNTGTAFNDGLFLWEFSTSNRFRADLVLLPT